MLRVTQLSGRSDTFQNRTLVLPEEAGDPAADAVPAGPFLTIPSLLRGSVT